MSRAGGEGGTIWTEQIALLEMGAMRFRRTSDMVSTVMWGRDRLGVA
jgi:hypothetical protein